MADTKQYDTDFPNEWCPGCGNFGILAGMKKALFALNVNPEALLIVSGIGQAGKTPHAIRCNMFHGLHGRALPLALGAKLANHELKIIVNSGDGDCYGEGGNHFIHAVRRNTDLTLLVHNNQVYGLTKGQASPTAALGMTTPLQPGGVVSEPFNGPAVALVLGAGFVARGFSGDPDHLSGLIQAAMDYKGFSLIDILQPCVSFNKVNTQAWYKERIYQPDTIDTEDFGSALKLAREFGETIPIGIFYQKEKTDFTSKMGLAQKDPLIDRAYDPRAVDAVLKAS